ncbi:hypothetical protein FHW75_003970 [Pseudomonas sp. OG7]|nr:hypothetical protein [Pseudomonas sp. OG7]
MYEETEAAVSKAMRKRIREVDRAQDQERKS